MMANETPSIGLPACQRPPILSKFSGAPGSRALPGDAALAPYLSMRVALLADFPTHALPGHEGSPSGHHATWLPQLASELEKIATGHDIHWITCTKDVSQASSLKAWGQTFHLLPRWKLSVEILTAFRRERRLISGILQKLQPDLVHAWGTEQGYALAAIDHSPDSLISMQGILQAYCRVSAMPWLTRIQARHEARVLKHARYLTVESPWGESQLRQLAPQAGIHLLEYGANSACFEIQRTLPSPASFQHFSISAFEHLPQKPLALFVGSPTHLKGIDTLLQAFSDPRLRHVELIILGTKYPTIERHPLPANIRLPGYRPPAEVREWMAKAWCLVHPTRADTSPNCVKEARVIGLPVVTTPNGGQTQYVEHAKSGFIHAAGDVEGLIEGVLAVTKDCETSLLMGSHGQAECRAKLHPSATAVRMLEIYQTVGRARRARR